jgi:UDP-2,4-diacetamido-2,4,6-trideoxy-beta-L-altropyranose hydrolase
MLAVFRADANLATGGGHVARCASLAHELRRRGWRTVLASRRASVDTVPFVTRAFDQIQDIEADDVSDMMRCSPQGCSIAVVDHYQRDAGFEAALRPWARRILVIDDLVDRPHDCDFLLDASLSRSADDYAAMVPNHARLLIGPEFALLRPDFAATRAGRLPRQHIDKHLRILVMFGATDHGDRSTGTIAALARSELPIEIEVVTGPTSPSLPELKRLAVQSPVPIELSVGVSDIARRMAAADIAIGGAGTISWERCCLGLPAVVVVLAQNQHHIARGLVRHGAALLVGMAPNVSGEQIADAVRDLMAHADRLHAMSRSAAILCDGLGAERVADAIIMQDD